MKAALLVACLLSFSLVPWLSAQEAKKPSLAPVLIKNSRSPDSRKEITITDTDPDGLSGGAQGIANVRDVNTGKSLGSFKWWGFGYHPNEGAFGVLWKSDGRAFAVTTEITRGYVECKVYALSANHRCKLVKLPDYVARIDKKYHRKSDFKGGEHPTEWLSGNRLLLDVFNRGWEEDEHGGTYQVTLRLSSNATATIESIHPSTP